MFVSYVVVVQHAPSSSRPRTVLMASPRCYAVVLLAPPLISTDVFSYQAYARMGAMYGANPYLNGPHAIALDSGVPLHRRQVVLHPERLRPGVHDLQLPAGAAVDRRQRAAPTSSSPRSSSLGIVALVWNAARLRGVDPVKAVALVGLNPLLVLYGSAAATTTC